MISAFAEWLDRIFMHKGEQPGETVPQAWARETGNIGEMAAKAGTSIGAVILKVFEPVKWVLFGISAVAIAWAFFGRKS